MSDIVNDLRNHLAGAINLHPAVNVRAVAVYTIEQAIAEIERLRAQRAAIRAKTFEDCAKVAEAYPSWDSSTISDIIRGLAQTDESKTETGK